MDDGKKVWVNGERIKALEVGQENMLAELKEINQLLIGVYGPDGMCYKERAAASRERTANAAAISNIKTHLKGIWTVITFIVVSIVGIFIDIIKAATNK